MLKREGYIKRISHILASLQADIRLRGLVNLYDSHIIAEDFMASLLNIVFGYQLENLNYIHKNQPGIDLGDSTHGIAFQITAERTRGKIQKTIDQFVEKGLYREYPQLRFFILQEKQRRYSPFNTRDSVSFNSKEHILDFGDLIQQIRASETEKLEEIVRFLEQEIREASSFTPLDSRAYAKHMLTAFAEWQERYTPLLAEYREFELYAIDTSSTGGPVEMPVLKVPEVAPVAILLGESGAGKTTSLWKLAVDLSSRLIRDEPTRLPVMVNLRNWSQSCNLRQLVQNQFSRVRPASEAVEEELVNGNCLILADGLNELPHVYDQKDAARRDLQNFLDRYPRNQYVFTCRTPDYAPEFLEVKPDHRPPSFEIRRLDRDQIEDYVRRNFRDESSRADDLLAKLNLRSDRHWDRQSSFVHLARIPLYLQMVIWEYRQTGYIPCNKGKMLHAFIAQVVQRDAVRQATRISLDGKTRVLGYLAYESIKAEHYLCLPENLAKTLVTGAFRTLRNEGAVPPDIVVDDVWQEILSNNFLHMRRGVSQQGVGESLPKVEWLHQLIFDYFLGHEIIRILVDSEAKEASEMRSSMTKFKSIWDQPCQIALGLLDLHRGAKLAEILFRTNTSLAQRAVKGQSGEDAANLAEATVQRVTQVSDWDAELLARIALALPYVAVVNRLRFVFKWCREPQRESIAMIMSQIVISHYGSEGAERAQDILEAWIANKNEIVRFYAAKGLWERARGHAAGALRELYAHGCPETQRLVRQLNSRWGLS